MATAKITIKGQITIPAKYRKKLNVRVVKVTMENNEIILKPIKELGGILNKYAFKDTPINEIMNLEKEAFIDAVKEKYDNH
ncbi:MAG: AbrB/MazE/SpoVT family DNA-binding domain-containing protein [Candidatus Parvarchaeota archaeon]